MGVPALFRWLSKKYPKIVQPVIEEEPRQIGDEVIPIDASGRNPNGVEFDNLYLDMNGIVHPCTHPEGKPAPETEEEMMVEIFNYTERVVNMVRPRKLLFMAIDGVAPRAKMNQQRSRRFRASQEAQEKEDARAESLELWKSMGKELTDEMKNPKAAWDSNAITPGTPFMTLLANSLRYWTVQKMNEDPAWKGIQVIISDASVPGEGEHKIMDFIRRQRVNPGHDPNTEHVIYGLDADLIMLSLATHEPHFRVLREDVFNQDVSSTACRKCGKEGHYAAQCTAPEGSAPEKPKDYKKPFIFLDVSILREYLEIELDVPNTPFPFDLERAIDDWVMLIFFVGNDFLPHLPSLEIREGAIDTLLKIWKTELPRMGGYLTNNGEIELARAQVILEGIGQREADIFRRRREAEQRQDHNAKRRKLEQEQRKNASVPVGPSPSLNLSAPLNGVGPPLIHPSLPQRPDFAARADSLGLGAPVTAPPPAMQSNSDIVNNRGAIRTANLDAANKLKDQLFDLVPLGRANKPAPPKLNPTLPDKPVTPEELVAATTTVTPPVTAQAPPRPLVAGDSMESDDMIPGFESQSTTVTTEPGSQATLDGEGQNGHAEESQADATMENGDADAEGEDDAEGEVDMDTQDDDGDVPPLAGKKRKLDEGPAAEDNSTEEEEDEEAAANASLYKMKKNADGSIEQADHVQLWEPGYRERYYKNKFGRDYSDEEFRKDVTTKYMEGLAWVLQYYYQGTPSWRWYYPYHFAPFAADFEDVEKMDLKFEMGQPFKPFEQLMGVFPAASRKHIPEVFHPLMTEADSPIIDFYPTEFFIDMNGKKMAWQGVALLPFIDEQRLLDAMAEGYPSLTEDEIHRNRWGNNVIFAADEHPVYPLYEALYGKRKGGEPVPLDVKLTKGISGTVQRNPDCLPGSTYESPIPALKDIPNDRSLSVLYFFPKQLSPHRSVLLPGAVPPRRQLTTADLTATRNGGRPPRKSYDNRNTGRGGLWREGSDRGGGFGGRGRGPPPHQRETRPYPSNGPPAQNGYGGGRGGYGGGGGGYGGYGGGGGGGGGNRGRPNDYGGYGGGSRGGYNSHGGGGGGGGYPQPSSYGAAPPAGGGYPGYGGGGASAGGGYGGSGGYGGGGGAGYGNYG
ncbi:putative strand exchange protein, partial [Schizophyllum commune]